MGCLFLITCIYPNEQQHDIKEKEGNFIFSSKFKSYIIFLCQLMENEGG